MADLSEQTVTALCKRCDDVSALWSGKLSSSDSLNPDVVAHVLQVPKRQQPHAAIRPSFGVIAVCEIEDGSTFLLVSPPVW